MTSTSCTFRRSYETLRKLLIEKGLHTPKRRRKVYRRRRRMPKAGLLVQMDSSKCRWIQGVEKEWWLIAMIDDASGYLYAEFHPQESTRSNLQVVRNYLVQQGLFMALYTDRASHFTTTRHGGLHYDTLSEYGNTQIQRALEELGIAQVSASTPQARGRIERVFRFFQDRLIKELRLRGIKDYEAANRFLKEEFLPWRNQRYTLPVESVYREIPKGVDLSLVFSIKQRRKVRKDNTIRYEGRIYQLLPAHSFRSYAGRWVEVCGTLEGTLQLF